jgi:hypothetical protein
MTITKTPNGRLIIFRSTNLHVLISWTPAPRDRPWFQVLRWRGKSVRLYSLTVGPFYIGFAP